MGFLLQRNVDKLRVAGCQMVDPISSWKELLRETHGDPCTDCKYNKDKKCPAYLQDNWHSTPRYQERMKQRTSLPVLVGGQHSGKTVRQIAKDEGISISEVRRRKAAGKYAA